MVLSHGEQVDRLRRSCPVAVPTAVVAGDPCFDRILASEPLRGAFRAELGVRDDQRLIFVSSTWGHDSLYGRIPDLVGTLRAELPVDEYAIALALHPNIWYGHSPWQLTGWLDSCLRDGVLVLPPEEGWRAGLVACDAIVGDQGSVTFYGAALRRPAVLAVRPEHTVDPASAVGRFLTAAPLLRGDRPLRAQLDDLLDRPRDATVEDATALVTSVPGRSFALLRTEIYRLLGLAEPPEPATARILPRLHPITRPRTATAVEVRGNRVVRYPAGSVARGVPPRPDTHLVVSTNEPDQVVLEAAEIVVHDEPGPAPAWLREILTSLPGALIATMPTRDRDWLIGTRDGTVLSVTTPADGEIWASVLYAWLCAGNELRAFPGTVSVELGGTQRTATVRVLDISSAPPASPAR